MVCTTGKRYKKNEINCQDALDAVAKTNPKAGKLKGLLFNDPVRFLNDLYLQLNMAASMYEFHTAVNGKDIKTIQNTLGAFITAVDAWQQKHGYSNHWYWPPMIEASRQLKSEQLNKTLNTLRWVSEDGETPFDKVKNGLLQLETYTPEADCFNENSP